MSIKKGGRVERENKHLDMALLELPLDAVKVSKFEAIGIVHRLDVVRNDILALQGLVRTVTGVFFEVVGHLVGNCLVQ